MWKSGNVEMWKVRGCKCGNVETWKRGKLGAANVEIWKCGKLKDISLSSISIYLDF